MTLPRKLRKAAAAVTAAIAIAGCAAGASAQLLYTTSFETSGTPAWTTGTVNGQNSWVTNDVANPASASTATYGQDAFEVTGPVLELQGPGGYNVVPVFDGSDMLQSATTYNSTSSADTYANVGYTNLYSAWAGRTATNNVVQTQAWYYLPDVDSTLTGQNGFQFLGGSSGQTLLATLAISNDGSGNELLTLTPQYGAAVTASTAQFPGILRYDRWTSLTTFMDEQTGAICVSIDDQIILGATNAFSTAASNAYYSSAFYNQSNTTDGWSSYLFYDDLNIVASTPGPGALPVFATGLAGVLFRLRSLRRRGASSERHPG